MDLLVFFLSHLLHYHFFLQNFTFFIASNIFSPEFIPHILVFFLLSAPLFWPLVCHLTAALNHIISHASPVHPGQELKASPKLGLSFPHYPEPWPHKASTLLQVQPHATWERESYIWVAMKIQVITLTWVPTMAQNLDTGETKWVKLSQRPCSWNLESSLGKADKRTNL